PVSVFVILGDTGVDVSIREINIATGVPSYIGGLAEEAVHSGERRAGMSPRFSSLVSSFFPAYEDPDDAAGRVELDNHVRTLVNGPDIVVFVDAHGVGFRPRIEALA